MKCRLCGEEGAQAELVMYCASCAFVLLGAHGPLQAKADRVDLLEDALQRQREQSAVDCERLSVQCADLEQRWHAAERREGDFRHSIHALVTENVRLTSRADAMEANAKLGALLHQRIGVWGPDANGQYLAVLALSYRGFGDTPEHAAEAALAAALAQEPT